MYYDSIKRAVDIIGALIALTLFAPIMLTIAIAIKITSPGPILVEKKNTHLLRIGKDGKIFRLYKFRSMPVNADSLITRDPRYRRLYKEWKETNFKLNKDPRVTKVGKFIRKYSVDETPQFFNVLRGEMSLVGPRPYHEDEIAEQLKRYPHTKDFIRQTQTVKPGITGYWQVNGRSDVNFDKRIEMDAYYAKKKSLILDFLIILKTPTAMISGRGAV